MASPGTRLVVAKALCKVEKDAAWSNLVWDRAVRDHGLDSRDSAFAGALFYGVLERRLTLDACIAAYCSVKPRKLSLPVLMALRIGLYQILYMDSVPDSAAVSESVETARQMKQAKSVGLVNAVLRAFLRADKVIPLPGDETERLSVEYSCPAPLIRLWRQSYGEEATLALLRQSLAPPSVHIRANTLRISPGELTARLEALGVECFQDADLPACLTLRGSGRVADLEPFGQGLFHVQDKASQLCALAVGAEPGMSVLDACAAPGGKAFALAQMMEDTGDLLAVDLYPQRTALLRRRAEEMGLTCIRAMDADMSLPVEGLGQFDRVLCDLPCSGLGVIARKPEIKYKPLEDFSCFPDIQYKILENTAQYCKVGGVLIYSTCTLNPAENTGVVRRFLEGNPQFEAHPLPPLLGGGPQKTFLAGEGTDGFFVAGLARKG